MSPALIRKIGPPALKALFRSRRWLFWLAAASSLLLDQLTKVLLWETPAASDGAVVVIPHLLRIVPHPGNTKGALGLGPQNPWFYISVAVVGLAVIGYFLATTPAEDGPAVAGLGLLAGGAVGNLIDRAALGYVRDFIDLHWGRTFHWHTFNVADAAICIGFFIVLVDVWFAQGEEESDAGDRSVEGPARSAERAE